MYKIACSMRVDISYSVIKICKNKFSEELLFSKKEIENLIHEMTSSKKLSPEIVSNIFKNIADDKEFISGQKCNSNRKHIGCLAGQKNCVVDSYGNVWPCSLFKGEEQYNYGNMFRDNPDELITRMNAEWSNLYRTYEECDNCKYFCYCTGGCRGNAYYSRGIQSKDPYCYLYSNLYYGLESNVDA